MERKEIEDPKSPSKESSERMSDLKLSDALREKFDSISSDGKREFRCFSNFLSLLCGELYLFITSRALGKSSSQKNE